VTTCTSGRSVQALVSVSAGYHNEFAGVAKER